MASFSNSAPFLDFLAPGDRVRTSRTGSTYGIYLYAPLVFHAPVPSTSPPALAVLAALMVGIVAWVQRGR